MYSEDYFSGIRVGINVARMMRLAFLIGVPVIIVLLVIFA